MSSQLAQIYAQTNGDPEKMRQLFAYLAQERAAGGAAPQAMPAQAPAQAPMQPQGPSPEQMTPQHQAALQAILAQRQAPQRRGADVGQTVSPDVFGAKPSYSVEAGPPQMPPQYAVDVGAPQVGGVEVGTPVMPGRSMAEILAESKHPKRRGAAVGALARYGSR